MIQILIFLCLLTVTKVYGITLSTAIEYDRYSSGFMFDVTNHGSTSIEITRFRPVRRTGSTSSGYVRVYTKSGTWVGSTSSSSGWTEVGKSYFYGGYYSSVGTHSVTISPVKITAGARQAFYIKHDAGSIILGMRDSYTNTQYFGTNKGDVWITHNYITLYWGTDLSTWGASYGNVWDAFMGYIDYNVFSPTKSPTTRIPTTAPSPRPTSTPTPPTSAPSRAPTVSPTPKPTPKPTENPSVTPTKVTISPTGTTSAPTLQPTGDPTLSTLSPSNHPSTSPTNRTTAPTDATSAPTMTPTKDPTSITLMPTTNPSVAPVKITTSPTDATSSPTSQPTVSPTKQPSPTPTKQPTSQPTVSPVKEPTLKPTVSPTKAPLPFQPTVAPLDNLYLVIRYEDKPWSTWYSYRFHEASDYTNTMLNALDAAFQFMHDGHSIMYSQDDTWDEVEIEWTRAGMINVNFCRFSDVVLNDDCVSYEHEDGDGYVAVAAFSAAANAFVIEYARYLRNAVRDDVFLRVFGEQMNDLLDKSAAKRRNLLGNNFEMLSIEISKPMDDIFNTENGSSDDDEESFLGLIGSGSMSTVSYVVIGGVILAIVLLIVGCVFYCKKRSRRKGTHVFVDDVEIVSSDGDTTGAVKKQGAFNIVRGDDAEQIM